MKQYEIKEYNNGKFLVWANARCINRHTLETTISIPNDDSFFIKSEDECIELIRKYSEMRHKFSVKSSKTVSI